MLWGYVNALNVVASMNVMIILDDSIGADANTVKQSGIDNWHGVQEQMHSISSQ